MQTPIRNPLFNTKAGPTIENLLPVGSVIDSFAFYSGDIELYLASRERFVSAHTEKEAIHDVWSTMLEGTTAVAEIASRIFPLNDEKDFPLLQEKWSKFKNPDVRAALFYFLNNCSDSGYVSKGAADTKNYNPVSLLRLKKFVKPESFHLSKIEAKYQKIQDSEADYIFLQFPKYFKNYLSEGMNRGVEEEITDVESLATSLKHKRYVLLTEPTKRLEGLFDCELIYIDQYGRETTEANSREVILHNV